MKPSSSGRGSLGAAKGAIQSMFLGGYRQGINSLAATRKSAKADWGSPAAPFRELPPFEPGISIFGAPLHFLVRFRADAAVHAKRFCLKHCVSRQIDVMGVSVVQFS